MLSAEEGVAVAATRSPERVTVRVWDLPTRVFHWTLVLSVAGSFTTGYIGGNLMDWHLRLGYVAFSLLLFRLLWGFFGGRWSRFRSFTYAPSTSLRYLRGESRADEHHEVGHNPLGAFSVYALLLLLAAQVGTGLFADDEIATTGPLNKFVAGSTAKLLTWWHKDVGQRVIMVLMLLHIGAIAWYWLRRRQNLLRPMLSGDKAVSPGVPASVDNIGTRMLALAILLAAAGIVAGVVEFGDD